MPTELGKTTMEMLNQYFSYFIDEKFSAHMEEELDDISEHKRDKNPCSRNSMTPSKKL